MFSLVVFTLASLLYQHLKLLLKLQLHNLAQAYIVPQGEINWFNPAQGVQHGNQYHERFDVGMTALGHPGVKICENASVEEKLRTIEGDRPYTGGYILPKIDCRGGCS